MEFDRESDLVSVIERKKPHRLLTKKRARAVLIREFGIGMTIPDLLIVGIPKKGGAIHSITMFQAAILSVLSSSKSVSRRALAARMYSSEVRLSRALDDLERRGLVWAVRDILRVRREVARASVEVVAIEAKLLAWRRAIEQAKSYTRFATSSYVALPASVINRRPKIEAQCRIAGLGLIEASSEAWKVRVASRRSRPHSPLWFWLLSRIGR